MAQPNQHTVKLFSTCAEIASFASREVARIADEAASARGVFTIALAGGSTPKMLYALLAEHPTLRNSLPWDKMSVFFGDERHVGPGHADSNFQMASDAMLSKVPLRPEQIHRIKGEYPDTAQAAAEYEDVIRHQFSLKPGGFPRFDLLLLGMGNEGHTLSLFPGTRALHETQRIVTRNWVGKLYTDRITLTAPAANAAANIFFMVTGSDKACALKAVLEGPHEPDQLPSQMIQPSNGSLSWLVDAAAGSMLSKEILT
ncbi:MAG TPA: 6-phosphogluconolactonase [Candidatus Acidoferrum sp.]|nr:6-phosphogluconolactonase [Candidatus Acidoferrum sp.]